MITPIASGSNTILAFSLSGKLHDADYQQFTPVIEAAVKAHGKIRVLAQFHDFHGWDLHALWDDNERACDSALQRHRTHRLGR